MKYQIHQLLVGLIGIEQRNYANWGMDVTIVEMQEHVLPTFLDGELAQALTYYLEQEDLNIRQNKVLNIVTDEKVGLKEWKPTKALSKVKWF